MPAEGFSPPDLIHGPLGALGTETGLWIIASGERTEPDALAALEPIRARAGVAAAISADPAVLAPRLCDRQPETQDAPDPEAPLPRLGGAYPKRPDT